MQFYLTFLLFLLIYINYVTSSISTTCYGKPTDGDDKSLSFLYYVTAPATIYYVLFPSNLTVNLTQNQLKDISIGKDYQYLTAGKGYYLITKPEKLEFMVSNLSPNTSYDIYFTSEVTDSHGIFGPILSLHNITTHPSSPKVTELLTSPVNGSSSVGVFRFKLDSIGILYYSVYMAGVISTEKANQTRKGNDVILVDKGIMQNHNVAKGAIEVQVINEMQEIYLPNLLPGTSYDIFYVTETLDTNGVRSELIALRNAFTTHFACPSLLSLHLRPLEASRDRLELRFHLAEEGKGQYLVNPNTIQNVEGQHKVEPFQVNVYYVLFESNTSMTEKSYLIANATRLKYAEEPIEGIKSIVAYGKVITTYPLYVDDILGHKVQGEVQQNGDSMIDLKYDIQRNGIFCLLTINALQPGMAYDIGLVAEVDGSHGVYSNPVGLAHVKTYAHAPDLFNVSLGAPNGSTTSLSISGDLSSFGTVHYILLETSSIYDHRYHRTQPNLCDNNEFWNTVNNAADENQAAIGVFNVSPTEEKTNSSYHFTELISGLKSATPYELYIVTETYGSKGVYSNVYCHNGEYRTNAKPMNIYVLEAKPKYNSSNAVEIHISKREDLRSIVNLCYRQLLTVNFTCTEISEFKTAKMEKSEIIEIGDLTSETTFEIYLFTESAERNSVYSENTRIANVTTYSMPPEMSNITAIPTNGTSNNISLTFEISRSPVRVHYGIAKTLTTISVNNALKILTKHASPKENTPADVPRWHSNTRNEASSFNQTKTILVRTNKTTLTIGKLEPNTSYTLYIVCEDIVGEKDGTGLLGEIAIVNTTTHDVPPTIVKALAIPEDGSTSSIKMAFNLSRPGILHYAVTDINGEDPFTIRDHLASFKERIDIRGTLQILPSDIIVTPWNRTEEPEPFPDVFQRQHVITGLLPDSIYRVSFCTETYNSNGLFGEFVTPILVRTHALPPIIQKETFKVMPTPTKSTSIDIKFRLSRYGSYHYILLFRGARREVGMEEAMRQALNISSNNYTGEYLAPISQFPISNLTANIIKEAPLERLGNGTVYNDSISVTRDEVFQGKTIQHTLKDLSPGSVYDYCYVTETSNSYGVFGWKNSTSQCVTITTHADFTNFSRLYDQFMMEPSKGKDDSLRLKLYLGKSSNTTCPASEKRGTTINDDIDEFGRKYCRIPYFILMNSKDGGTTLSNHAIQRNYKHILLNPSYEGDESIIANGALTTIKEENETHLLLEQEITGLEADTMYAVYWASLTYGSKEVFTAINPYYNQSFEKKDESIKGILMKTNASPPRLHRVWFEPAYGEIKGMIMHYDFSCSSCSIGIIHLFVFEKNKSPLTESAKEYMHDTNLNQTQNGIIAYLNVTVELERNEHKKEKQIVYIDGIPPDAEYEIRYATETANAFGVISDFSHVFSYIAHQNPPTFTSLQVSPKQASTTEILLQIALSSPGEVHFVSAPSGLLVNITSPYHITHKKPPEKDRKRLNWTENDYKLDNQEIRRQSLKFETIDFLPNANGSILRSETIGYLKAGVSYDIFLMIENPYEKGIFTTEIFRFYNITTLRQAPMIVSHSVIPLKGSTSAFELSYRINQQGLLHFIVTHNNITRKSDVTESFREQLDYALTFENGNRIGYGERILLQRTIRINESMINLPQIEVIKNFPFPGEQYNIFLVTESIDSQGVYGVVAKVYGIKTYNNPPVLLENSIRPADGRNDALELRVVPKESCVVHYVVCEDPTKRCHETESVAHGQFLVNTTKTMLIEGLKPEREYFIYLATETAQSMGVLSPFSTIPLQCKTHPAPPLPLEEIDCSTAPNCTELNREECWMQSGLCGECMNGFTGSAGPGNDICRLPGLKKPNITVKLNPKNVRLSFAKKSFNDTKQNTTAPPQKRAEWSERKETNPCPMHAKLVAPRECQCDKGYMLNEESNACIKIKIPCPPNASPSTARSCECNDGFYLNPMLNACVKTFDEL